jgi:hypothetical protein
MHLRSAEILRPLRGGAVAHELQIPLKALNDSIFGLTLSSLTNLDHVPQEASAASNENPHGLALCVRGAPVVAHVTARSAGTHAVEQEQSRGEHCEEDQAAACGGHLCACRAWIVVVNCLSQATSFWGGSVTRQAIVRTPGTTIVCIVGWRSPVDFEELDADSEGTEAAGQPPDEPVARLFRGRTSTLLMTQARRTCCGARITVGRVASGKATGLSLRIFPRRCVGLPWKSSRLRQARMRR